MTRGLLIGGRIGELIARQKAGSPLEMGELLVAELDAQRILLQVHDLLFASQLSQQNLEMISGMRLEEEADLEFLEPHQRTYTLALLKELAMLDGTRVRSAKSLPPFFSTLREVTAQDLPLTKPSDAIYLGDLRSGSRRINVAINLPGRAVLTHHLLIPATTGRGKSNLMKVVLWDLIECDWAGTLVLDPHDEYYRSTPGLRDHPAKERIRYYSVSPEPGQPTLRINIRQLKPSHFNGAVEWSEAQHDCIAAYHREHDARWVEAIINEESVSVDVHDRTKGVVRRRLLNLLQLEQANGSLTSHGPIHLDGGTTTVADIARELEKANTVVIDTSSFDGPLEILIGSVLASEVLRRYRRHKRDGSLANKPIISILLEEAPRVLGEEVLKRGANIFSTIAREGRKFGVGLIAITQLPSLIPRQIRANMNTKIILGLEMRPERQAIIDSAAQDLSSDDRAIAGLDRGEAIITSNFATFAIPIRIPLFEEHIATAAKPAKGVQGFAGVKR